MNIAQLLDSLAIGGMQRVAVDLANGLAAEGHVSHLICTRDGGQLADKLRPDVRLFINKRNSRYDVGALRRIGRYLSENNIEFVQSHNDSSHYFTRLCLAFHPKPRPFHICHAHSAPVQAGRAQGLRSRLIDRLLLGRADLHIAAAEEMRDYRRTLLGFPDDRCVYLPNAIVVPAEVASPTSRKAGKLEILQVANLHWPKGHANAIHIAGRLRQRKLDFTWRMIGRVPGPGSRQRAYYNELLRLIDQYDLGNSVSFEGEQNDIGPFLNAAQIGVLTSDSEAFPITLLEYMAAALPVIATDVGQNGAIINNAQCGAVHAPEDHDAFADSLSQLAEDWELREKWGQAGRNHVLENYELSNVLSRLTSLYRRLKSTRNSPSREGLVPQSDTNCL